jgi:DinB superfamily
MFNMKRQFVAGMLAMALTLGAGSVAQADTLVAADRESAMKYLETTKKNIEEAVKGLSEAQFNFKAGPDRWSVAQVLEHIAAAEDLLRGMIEEKVLKAPAAPDRDTKKIDAMVLAGVPDRSTKFQAPPPLQPTNRFNTPADTLKHFEESRQKTEDLLKNTTDLRDHATDSPMGVKLDGYEWILFIAAHSERHTKQILEVKADPNFPKS